MNAEFGQMQHMETLSRLLVRTHGHDRKAAPSDLHALLPDLRYVDALSAPQLGDLLSLADTHHVIARVLAVLRDVAVGEKEKRMAEWCGAALDAELARIERSLGRLQSLCDGLESRGCEVVVIKSLDHWPDLGSDLDLYTAADGRQAAQIMQQDFGATRVERSWGDRLAGKWNYQVPGLRELVEIHIQCLGQTGEHTGLARRVTERRVRKTLAGHDFYVPAPEERIAISVLQRMYRHLYFRLCDIIETASLLQAGAVDLGELRRAATEAGIWPGVATFLTLIQNYIESWGGRMSLPDEVSASAYSHRSKVRFQHGFLRVPMATAAVLYSSQLLQAGVRRDVRALSRLPLLPPLAASAIVAHSLTGNDKGIW
jgi:hypothetical protein